MFSSPHSKMIVFRLASKVSSIVSWGVTPAMMLVSWPLRKGKNKNKKSGACLAKDFRLTLWFGVQSLHIFKQQLPFGWSWTKL